MSEYKYDTDYLEVGDTMEGGPIEQSYFISAVLAVGGEIEIDGDIITILQLPKKIKAKAPVYVEPPVIVPVVEPPVIKPPVVEEMLVKPLSIVEEAPAPAPVVRTRKPKVTPAVSEKNEVN